MKTYQKAILISTIAAMAIMPSFGCKFKHKEHRPKEKTVFQIKKEGDGIEIKEKKDSYKIKAKKGDYKVEVEIPKERIPYSLPPYPNHRKHYNH